MAQEQPVLLDLNSVNPAVRWKVQSAVNVGDNYAAIFAPNYNVASWVKGQVPGTTFVSYVRAGIEKDPNFGDNIYQVDKSKYDRDFWYRAEFRVPAVTNKMIWLNFDGVNRQGEVYFNGKHLGRLNGFMERGHFDITPLIRKNGNNVLGVLVRYPRPPIPNLASPTYISSASWDWMPYVPGLLSGITDDVYLTTSGSVTLADPWIRTELPSSKKAELSLQVEVSNHSQTPQTGTLSGIIQPGNVRFSQPVTLAAGQTRTVTLTKRQFPQFVLQNPRLWYPNGYGAPNLYQCNLMFRVNKASDIKTFRFGIKKYSYDTEGGVFHLSVNGKRVFLKGGNWGMSEYLLRCRGSEYDLKVKLHKDMNFNMIRNWIGSTTDEEFYAACDKYGILVWDDFWLNSHANLPTDLAAFNKNAVEKIKRFRNHPAIAVWCGDNEGTPLPPLNDQLRQAVATYDGGDRWYQPNSNTGALSGSGPWVNRDPAWYFTKYPVNFSNRPSFGMRTEIGTAVFPNVESFQKFMPKENWWPRNAMWDRHFFGPSAGNAGPDYYEQTIDRSYGKASGIEEFCRKAQLLNLETNKAMFEGWQHHMWNDASGVLTWMSQSAYPSLVWQTYDYYYDATGAYWGVKKACEPVHIQWNSGDNSVKIINTSAHDITNVRAQAVIYNLDGRAVPGLGGAKAVALAASNRATAVFDLNFNPDNLAYKAATTASSEEGEGKEARAATDGGTGSRWSSKYTDDEWIMVDLGSSKTVTQVNLVWEAAYAKRYKLQVSGDKTNWSDVFTTDQGNGGTDAIRIAPTTARYVRLQGMQRATPFGYSLYEFEVYTHRKTDLSNVHFVALKLTDQNGKLLSDNLYWRSQKGDDYTDFNTLPPARLKVTSKTTRKNNKMFIQAHITNPPSSPTALAVRVTPVKAATGEQILPVLMNDNYFSLMKGQSKNVTIELDQSLVGNQPVRLRVEPYNNRIAAPVTAKVQSAPGKLPDLVRYVIPLNRTESIGGFSTGGTLPLVARPFGMTDWSLQTGEGNWGWWFSPQERKIQGVRATHQPSPWMGDYGYFTVMAQTGNLYLKPGQRTSAYRIEESTIKPNYLRVPLRRYGTLLEMTPTERCSLFRFSFPKEETGRVLLQTDSESQIRIDPETGQISGFTRSKPSGVPDNFACYFVARFSRPWKGVQLTIDDKIDEKATQINGKQAGAAVEFESGAPVVMQIGTSFISAEQARQNLENEIGGKDFEAVRAEGESVWNETLNRLTVSGATDEQRETFYSCLYRAHLFPRQFHEIDAKGKTVHYSPYDGQVHDGVMYTDTGFWDTYRTAFPLLSLIQPKRYGEMVEGFLQGYREGGWLAQWPSPGYRVSMPGTHGDAVIADGIVKNIGGFDKNEAYAAITKHAEQPSTRMGAGRNRIADYLRLGYMPGSVSETLDFAYDDFCVSQVAQSLGKSDDAQKYRQRSLNYRNLYDPEVGFMRAKEADGKWRSPFNQYAWGGPYVEGGPWQSTWAVQHDPAGLIALMGGRKKFVAKLDQMMTMPPRYDIGEYGTEIHEITEMAVTNFGQYAHNNQPVHHVLYLYTAAGQPWKTQYWTRRVMSELYSPQGFAGDEDNGEMSSWYVLNALGIYPLCPGRPEYVLGSPLFSSVRVHVPGRKDLVIAAPENSTNNIYVQNVSVNGEAYDPLWIPYQTLTQGGTLQFDMGPKPRTRDYTSNPALLPHSLSPYKP